MDTSLSLIFKVTNGSNANDDSIDEIINYEKLNEIDKSTVRSHIKETYDNFIGWILEDDESTINLFKYLAKRYNDETILHENKITFNFPQNEMIILKKHECNVNDILYKMDIEICNGFF